jgi:hypothetical protein
LLQVVEAVLRSLRAGSGFASQRRCQSGGPTRKMTGPNVAASGVETVNRYRTRRGSGRLCAAAAAPESRANRRQSQTVSNTVPSSCNVIESELRGPRPDTTTVHDAPPNTMRYADRRSTFMRTGGNTHCPNVV